MSKAQLARLIDLPDDALQQVLDYAATLSKADAVDHFKNLLGEAPAALEFIAAFNARRHDPAAGSVAAAAAGGSGGGNTSGKATNSLDAVPKHQRAPKKKKAPLHTPAARQVTSLAPPPGATYHKKDREEDYISGRSGASTPHGPNRATTPVSAAITPPPPPETASPSPAKQQQKQAAPPSSGAGTLIQDALAPKTKNKSSANSGSGSSTAKISLTGGTAMHGAATALADFDAAIRALEISTNPTLSDTSKDDVAARRCNCVATRHPLQTAAPNCQNCGKVICVKEGLGPCTFCGTPLLAAADVQAMIKELRAERGREKMAADKAAHQRHDGGGNNRTKYGSAARPHMIAGTTKWGGDDADYVTPAEADAKTHQQQAEAQARAHRDKLLAFQAQNAQRTTVRDEAADFDVGDALAAEHGDSASSNIWATPEERARALRNQQKLLREMAWNARPEYEKRQQVVSIDLTGRKVFRKTVAAERPPTPRHESTDEDEEYGGGAPVLGGGDANRGAGGGAFSHNPLLGGLIKPVYDPKARSHGKEEGTEKGKGKGKSTGADEDGENADALLPGRKDDPKAATRWRRVQDDLDNNEDVILDGGLYGAAGPVGQAAAGDEPE